MQPVTPNLHPTMKHPITCLALSSLLLVFTAVSLLAVEVGEQITRITTKDGKTYHQVVIRKIEPEGISIVHRDGTARIPGAALPESLTRGHKFVDNAIVAKHKTASGVALPQAGKADSAQSTKERNALCLLGAAKAVTFSGGGTAADIASMYGIAQEKSNSGENIAEWLPVLARQAVGARSATVLVSNPTDIKTMADLLGREQARTSEQFACPWLPPAEPTIEVTWYDYGWLHFGVVDGNVQIVRADYPKASPGAATPMAAANFDVVPPKFAGTLRMSDGKVIRFSNLNGIRLKFRVEGNIRVGDWVAVPGKLVLVRKTPEEIALSDIARIEFGKEGMEPTVEFKDGRKKTFGDVIVMIDVVEEGTEIQSRYGGKPLDGASIALSRAARPAPKAAAIPPGAGRDEKNGSSPGAVPSSPPPAAVASSSVDKTRAWPAFSGLLSGSMEVQVRNPNEFSVKVGLRSDAKGVDFSVPANGVNSVFVPNGHYRIYFHYSTDPGGLYQGDNFSLQDNDVEIQIVKVVNGNYGIRKVK
jgi:hypothetical protein